MSDITLYGIPTCESCRKARKWLDSFHTRYLWVDLRQEPPGRARLELWVGTLGAKPLRNTSGKAYRALGDEKKGWEDDRWVRAFVQDPMLIKRPVLEIGGEVRAVGFKPDVWQDLLRLKDRSSG